MKAAFDLARLLRNKRCSRQAPFEISRLRLDRPVSVIRANWVGAYTPAGMQTGPLVTSPMAFYPHYLDAGQPYIAAFADGQISRCVGTGNAQRCLTPALNFRSDFLPWAQGSYVEAVWLGSLLSDKQDKTLTFYRRNRVYDPLTRQFTQEDPIGLAGGVNVYGFAAGDPVNFSDPFGLCPVTKEDPTPCRVSDAGIQFIAGFEGFRANEYNDVAGKSTIGYGHLITAGEKFDHALTKEEGLALLKSDLENRVNSGLDRIKVHLEQNQVDALGSFTFNVGARAFRNSSLLKQLNQGDYGSVPGQLNRWNRAGGHVVSDLTQRRKAEGQLFTNGVY